VNKTAFGIVVPWRDAGSFGPGFQFSADGYVRGPAKKILAPSSAHSLWLFAALGVPSSPAAISISSTARQDGWPQQEPVVIVSQLSLNEYSPIRCRQSTHLLD